MSIRTTEEIKTMRRAGKILAEIFVEIESLLKPDLVTYELEIKFLDLCKKYNVIPSCKGYKRRGSDPFPTGLCISINNESVHCYPRKDKIIRDGDSVLIDTVISLDGLHVDSSKTYLIGDVTVEKKLFVETAKLALDTTIKQVKAGIKTGVLSNTMYSIAKIAGYDVLRGYTGHGIGRQMHESPSIPCFGEINSGEVLKEGMTITIEPLFCSGSSEIVHKKGDDWETYLKDGGDYAQFEHTLLVTKNGCEILTKV